MDREKQAVADMFAAHAMAALIIAKDNVNVPFRSVVRWSWEFSREMMIEREVSIRKSEQVE